MSSRFVHLTVAPTATVSAWGPNEKLSIFTSAAFAGSCPRKRRFAGVTFFDTASNSTTEAIPTPKLFNTLFLIFCSSSPGFFLAQARFESTTASAPFPLTKFTSVIPSTLRSCCAGTFIGPGEGAVPGAGCGNAVDAAV